MTELQEIHYRLGQATSKLNHWAENRDAILSDKFLCARIKISEGEWPGCAKAVILCSGEEFNL